MIRILLIIIIIEYKCINYIRTIKILNWYIFLVFKKKNVNIKITIILTIINIIMTKFINKHQ